MILDHGVTSLVASVRLAVSNYSFSCRLTVARARLTVSAKKRTNERASFWWDCGGLDKFIIREIPLQEVNWRGTILRLLGEDVRLRNLLGEDVLARKSSVRRCFAGKIFCQKTFKQYELMVYN